MIIVVPAVSSPNISPSVINGVAKMMERFLLIQFVNEEFDEGRDVNTYERSMRKTVFGESLIKELTLEKSDSSIPEFNSETGDYEFLFEDTPDYKIKLDAPKVSEDEYQKEIKKRKEELRSKEEELTWKERRDDEELKKRRDELESEKQRDMTSRSKKREQLKKDVMKSKEEREKLRKDLEKEKEDYKKKKKEFSKEYQDRIDDLEDREKEQKKKHVEIQKQKKIELNMGNPTDLALEPTYVTINVTKPVTSGDKYSSVSYSMLIGVKVIVYPLKTIDPYSYLFTSDFASKKIRAKIKQTRRSLWNWAHKTIRKIPILGRLVAKTGYNIKGDPYKDIIYNRTEFGKDMFVIMGRSDIEIENVFAKQSKVRKMYKLGWRDFVICDDVNQTANFCMKNYKGLCTSMPYSYIMNTLRADNVFASMEELKKQSSPFLSMRRSKSIRKIASECLASEIKGRFLING